MASVKIIPAVSRPRLSDSKTARIKVLFIITMNMYSNFPPELVVSYLVRKKKEGREINRELSSPVFSPSSLEKVYSKPDAYKDFLEGRMNRDEYLKEIEIKSEGLGPIILDLSSVRYEMTQALEMAKRECTEPEYYFIFPEDHNRFI